MKSFARARSFVALLMVVFLVSAPLVALAKKGDKNYKRGVEFEKAQQWDKAAQEFALAVAAAPSDTEYQLHYRRSIFNASQVLMQKGRALADQGDYVGAYNAFRQAYGFDPVNELAAQEMNRMMRLQREKEGDKGGAEVSPTSYRRSAANGVGGVARANGVGAVARNAQEAAQQPERVEQLQNINYNGELEPFIRKLADELNLNVIFDQNFSQVKRTINLKLKDVTAARALDHIFTAYSLFYQKLDRRTILVADQSKRPQYQQLVLRTFYLYNIKPDQARTLLQSALPANAGRQPAFAINDNTNSITVRDTPENIRIIAQLLQGIDKDRAEVVMEVSIYEVSRTDLLQIGNQIGSADTLGALGGLQPATVLINRGARAIVDAASKTVLPTASGIGLLIPASSISALQSRSNTRLIFSTQVHAFDDEKSETRVGSKVPVQTASVFNSLAATPQSGGAGGAGTAGVFGGGGFPVIQYEDTGLVLDFKPKVYPNQDVQVTMNIETKDLAAGPDPLTPIFTQRKISGVARIPNGKTMMIASVAQDRQTSGRTGLPILGLIPILGRLFTAPRRDNTTSDVVITMTPRVLRAPEITPDDEQTRDTGSMQQPKAESLEAMIIDAEREEQLAKNLINARKLPTTQTVQLPPPPGEDVSFVPAPKSLAGTAANLSDTSTTAATTTAATTTTANPPAAVNASVKTPDGRQAMPAALSEQVKPESIPVVNTTPNTVAALTPNVAPTANAAAATESVAELLLMPERQEMKVGERRRVMVFLKTDAPVGLATATLRFDPRALAVRSVSRGMLTADASRSPVLTQSVDPSGVLLLSVTPAAGAQPLTGEGLLLMIEVEALSAGDTALTVDPDKLHLIASDGRSIRARFNASGFKVIQ